MGVYWPKQFVVFVLCEGDSVLRECVLIECNNKSDGNRVCF